MNGVAALLDSEEGELLIGVSILTSLPAYHAASRRGGQAHGGQGWQFLLPTPGYDTGKAEPGQMW